MNFIFQNQFFVLLGLLAAGFAVIGWFLRDFHHKMKKLFGGGSKGGGDLNNDLLRRVVKLETTLEEIEPRIKFTEEISRVSIQKTGFLRFNPFHDTGGDNSFVLVLLDYENNGVVITSLYLREGIRLYAKRVERGGTKQQLSEEEKKILEETIKK